MSLRNLVGTFIGSINVSSGSSGSGGWSGFIDIPTPESLSSPTTLSSGDAYVQTGDGDEVYPSEPFTNTRLVLDTSVATGVKIRSQPGNRTEIGAGTLASSSKCISDDSGQDFLGGKIYYMLLDADNVSGTSGVEFAAAGGNDVELSDLIMIENRFAGFLLNSGNGADNYGTININFCRDFGQATNGGEGFYLGNTSKTAGNYDYLEAVVAYHNFFTNKGREGNQITHCESADFQNNTYYNVGQGGGAGQNRLFQVHNTLGTFQYELYVNADASGEILSHGVTFYRCYFRWNGASASRIYIGSLISNFGAGALANTNAAIRFEECIFDPSASGASGTSVFVIASDECDVEVINCGVGPELVGVDMFDDQRGTSVYTLTETGTYNYTGGVPAFHTNVADYTEEATHGLLDETDDAALGLLELGISYRAREAA